MTDPGPNPQDIFGFRPFGEAIRDATRASLEAVGAFLGRICLPAAEEIGLLLRDQVSYWRGMNALRIAQKAEAKLMQFGPIDPHSHPRIAIAALGRGSWTDDEEVQDMWAGLLASSCTNDGRDESNLIFINLLDQLTSAQARLLNHVCTEAEKTKTGSGLIWGEWVYASINELKRALAIDDIHRLDREMDHLRALHLIEGGLPLEAIGQDQQIRVQLQPTPLALHMYVRCQGSRESPLKFFGLDT